MKQIEFYEKENGKIPVKIWIDSLGHEFFNRITKRLIRIENGNFGDYKKINNEISELRFDFGSGYRIYFSEIENVIVLLLCAGDKSTQTKDIEKAKEYLKDWRKKNEKI